MAELILSTQLKICNVCNNKKNVSEFTKKKRGKFGVRAHCKKCQKIYNKKHAPSKDSQKEYNRNYRLANIEKERARCKKRSDQKKRYYEINREKILNYCSDFAKRNPQIYAFQSMKRICAKRKATPGWADFGKIKYLYLVACAMNKDTGAVHHVDHIVPLISKFVCGLHVENNLRVVTAKDNISKGNRYWPDMP